MRVSYSTAQAVPAARKWYWDRAVTRTYFPLELGFRSAPGFSGELDVWSVGNVSISRSVTDGTIGELPPTLLSLHACGLFPLAVTHSGSDDNEWLSWGIRHRRCRRHPDT